MNPKSISMIHKQKYGSILSGYYNSHMVGIRVI